MEKNRITGSVILALTTLVSAFVWLGLKDFLYKKEGLVLALVCFLIVCVLLSLSWLLLKSRIILITTLLIVLFGFLIAFGFTLPYIIAALIALIFLFFGSCQAMNEKNVRIKVKISQILKVGMPSLFTGLLLLVSVSYYFSPMSIKEFEIPRPLFDSIMKIVPFPSSQMNLSSLIPGLEGIDLKNIDMGELESAFGTQIGTQIKSGNFDVSGIVGSEEEQKEFLYEMINQNIKSFIEPYKKYLAVGLAISLFFILKTISVPFMWLVIFLNWLIFKLLVFVKAIQIREKSVLQEIIE